MITLGFQFPAGRYHATPWGHQVNEGLVEWPASPWRLLRALLSSGYTRLGWKGSPPAAAASLFVALSNKAPEYSVPQANIAHSRHYMPTGTLRSSSSLESTTLVLDTWANVGDTQLQVHWDVDLPPEQRELLSALVQQLNYLGRSESWTVGRVLNGADTVMPVNMRPHLTGSPVERNEELVTLMAPVAMEVYAAWRLSRVPQVQNSDAKKPSAKQLKEQAKLEAPYPSSLLEALEWDTSRWKSFGWSQPPGSQLVQYRRPRDIMASSAPPVVVRGIREEPVDMILLALASHSGSAGLLPSVTRTLPQAEMIHDALVNLSSRDGQVPPDEITGRSDDGSPLQGHRHCHVLPMDVDSDGHLDHVLLWSKMGFSRAAQEAVASLRRTFTKGGKEALRVAIAGRTLQSGTTTWPDCVSGYVARSHRWVTITPFVAPRFLKKSGTNALDGQLRAELKSRGLPEPSRLVVSTLPVDGLIPNRTASLFRHFVRVRARGGSPPPQQNGWFIEIEFPEAIQGPLCLGYASHFGLGLFVPADH